MELVAADGIAILSQRRIYQTEYPYFLTTVTQGRVPVFDDPGKAALLNAIIQEACRMHAFHLHAFCILLDHLQILVEGKTRQKTGKQP